MTPAPLLIAVLASHNGSTLQALIAAIAAGTLPAKIGLVLSNNSRAIALQRAKAANLPTLHISAHTEGSAQALDDAMLAALNAHHVEVVACCGYMKKIGPKVLAHYAGRVLNMHPSLLPAYGGEGMYGLHVHRAVLAAKERRSGATLHVVTEAYDQGPILAQRCLPVPKGMAAEDLQRVVQQAERQLYVEVLARLAKGDRRERPPHRQPG